MLPVSIDDVGHGVARHEHPASFESGVDLFPEHQIGFVLGVTAAASQLQQTEANNAVRLNGQRQDCLPGEKHGLPCVAQHHYAAVQQRAAIIKGSKATWGLASKSLWKFTSPLASVESRKGQRETGKNRAAARAEEGGKRSRGISRGQEA
jgi:hypothetical protein